MESFQILPPGGVAPLSVNISFWPKRLIARVFFWIFFGSFQNLGQNTTYIKILEGCFLFKLFYRPKCKQSNAIRPLRPCKGQTNDLTLLRPTYFGSGHCQLSAGTSIFIFWPQTPEKMDKKWVRSCLVFLTDMTVSNHSLHFFLLWKNGLRLTLCPFSQEFVAIK